jgi:hypothetical protein
MKGEFITTLDPRWKALLDSCPHDAYHLPECVECAAAQEGGVPMAFFAQDEHAACLIPLLARPLPERLYTGRDWYDLTSPYGYPGLVCTTDDAECVAKSLDSLRAAADDFGACTVFLRLHPLLNTWTAMPIPMSACVDHGETVSVDLTVSDEEMWRRIRDGYRYDIRRLQRMGFTVVMDDWSGYGDFAELYRQTMERLGADRFYHFGDAYFRDLKSALKDNLHLCSVLAPDGRIAAGALFMTVDGLMEYHLSASAAEFSRYSPTKLMIHSVCIWGKLRGCSRLHLGGGLGARQDALFRFKAGFSPGRGRFRTLRMIANETRYLEMAFAADLSQTPEADLSAEFFPPYRRLPRHKHTS